MGHSLPHDGHRTPEKSDSTGMHTRHKGDSNKVHVVGSRPTRTNSFPQFLMSDTDASRVQVTDGNALVDIFLRNGAHLKTDEISQG